MWLVIYTPAVFDVPSLRVLFAVLVGWLDRQQQETPAYLAEENRILRGQPVYFSRAKVNRPS
jgi:hypothetical protein